MDLTQTLLEQLEIYRSSLMLTKQCLQAYEKLYVEIIFKIKKCSFDDSQIYFDQLFELQTDISIAYYKYDFPVNAKLKFIIKSFERLDTMEDRAYWYDKLCTNSI